MPLGRTRRVRRRRAAIVAGGAYAAHKYRQHQEQADEAAAPTGEAPAQDRSTGSSDDTSKLVQLKSLLDSGALTQAEFDAEKQKILRA